MISVAGFHVIAFYPPPDEDILVLGAYTSSSQQSPECIQYQSMLSLKFGHSSTGAGSLKESLPDSWPVHFSFYGSPIWPSLVFVDAATCVFQCCQRGLQAALTWLRRKEVTSSPRKRSPTVLGQEQVCVEP